MKGTGSKTHRANVRAHTHTHSATLGQGVVLRCAAATPLTAQDQHRLICVESDLLNSWILEWIAPLLIRRHAAVGIQVTLLHRTPPTKGSAEERMMDALHHLRSEERESLKANLCAFHLGCSALPRLPVHTRTGTTEGPTARLSIIPAYLPFQRFLHSG